MGFVIAILVLIGMVDGVITSVATDGWETRNKVASWVITMAVICLLAMGLVYAFPALLLWG